MNKLRSKRKNEHLILALQGSRCSFSKGVSEIRLIHDCLTTITPEDVDLGVKLWDYQLATPIYINAVTGGTAMASYVNKILTLAAKRFQIPLAVGSQSIALDQPQAMASFTQVRKIYPQGVILANLSAGTNPKRALAAISMMDAQVLQLHLNSAQEMIMPEGDSPNPRLLENIAEICALSPVPVMVKEVGFGIAGRQAEKLSHLGISCLDVSGTGGTNFAWIEGKRGKSRWWMPLADWGLPTPLCVAEAVLTSKSIPILASGGLVNGVQIAQVMALGASGAGIAGGALGQIFRGGQAALDGWLSDVIRQLKTTAALCGVKQVDELKHVPVLITGTLGEMFRLRGIDLETMARRQRR